MIYEYFRILIEIKLESLVYVSAIKVEISGSSVHEKKHLKNALKETEIYRCK